MAFEISIERPHAMKSRPHRSAPHEVELKLSLPGVEPDELAQRLARLPALARRKWSRLTLHNIYFDTPDQALRQRGVALRLRRVGNEADRRWLQTLKTSGGERSALSQRGEWESPVAGPALEHAALAHTAWTSFDPDGHLFAALAPCFVTRFERTLWLLRRRTGGVVEVALDIGQVEANGRQAPICELELELKAGEPAALFDLARQLGRGVALLPANRSKAERGFLLAQGALDWPQHAQQTRLDWPLSRLELAQAVLREMFAQFSQNLETLCSSDDPEVVHQARVGWRRLRSGLRLFHKTLAVATPPSCQELQPLLMALGVLRDLDVAVTETLPTLAEGYTLGDAGRSQAWQAVMTALTQAANAQRQQLRQMLQEPTVGLCLLALTEWLENMSAADRGGSMNKGALRRWARHRTGRLQQRLAQAQETTDTPQQQHRVRILAKRLRYGVEVMRALLPRKLADACIQQAMQLQSRLGMSRDVAQANALVAGLNLDPLVAAYLRGVVAGFRAGLATAR